MNVVTTYQSVINRGEQGETGNISQVTVGTDAKLSLVSPAAAVTDRYHLFPIKLEQTSEDCKYSERAQ